MAAGLPLDARFAAACQGGDKAALLEALDEVLEGIRLGTTSADSSGSDSDEGGGDSTAALMILHNGFADVCAAGHQDLLQVLLDLPTGVLHPTFKDCIALRRAGGGGHGGVVKTLLELQGMDVNAYSGSPLASAAANGHSAVVEVLLARGADPAAARGASVAAACTLGHTDIAQMLLDTGAVQPTGSHLMSACNGGHVETVLLLLGHKLGGDLGVHLMDVGMSLAQLVFSPGTSAGDRAALVEAITDRELTEYARSLLQVSMDEQREAHMQQQKGTG